MNWVVILLIFASADFSQAQTVPLPEPRTEETEAEALEWRKDLIDHYKKTLPQSYIHKLKKINVVRSAFYNQDKYDQLLKELMEPKSGIDPVPGAIECIQNTYTSLTISDFQSLVLAISRYVGETSKKIKCESNKDSMTYTELMRINAKLKRDKDFNNDWPGGACFDRAYLISYELDKMGYKSNQLQMNDYVVAAYKRKNGYIAESYPVHIANVVKVSIDGKMVDYVIDPIYLDEPVTLAKYKELTLVNKDSQYTQILSQDFTNDDRSPDPECAYSKYYLDEARTAVRGSYKRKPKLDKTRVKESREQAISDFKLKHFSHSQTTY